MAVLIKCERGKGDREASPIIDEMIVNENMAVRRGKRFLDDPSQGGYYLVRNRKLRVPHKSSAILPGTWITVTDGKIGLADTLLRVTSYSVIITPEAVWADIDTQTFEELPI